MGLIAFYQTLISALNDRGLVQRPVEIFSAE